MAMNRNTSVWHFGVRVLGLAGLVALFAGLGLYAALPTRAHKDHALTALQVGAIALGLVLLFEIRGLLRLAFSRRGAVGASVALQVVLAVALLLGANAFAFFHYQRYDWTSDRHFTIPADVRARLEKLRDPTDIVVYQQYVSFGERAENRQDKYDLAAQKKIVEKVRDLAEEFQDLGPRFRVQVLDIQDDYYPEKFEKIKNEAPKLAEAIEQAPENSVFFYTRGRDTVQRLSFSDIYQLDKKTSQEKNNLVLTDQGVEGFANKVFNIEQRKPRIGFAIVHEWLGQEQGHEDYGMPGLKQVFATRGYEGRDIILKKGWGRRLEPTVLTHAENRYEVLEAQRKNFERISALQREERAEVAKQVNSWKTATLAEINKQFVLVETVRGLVLMPKERLEQIRKQIGRLPPYQGLSEEDRKEFVDQFQAELDEADTAINQVKERLDKVKEEQGSLRVEDLAEQRRITDLRAKFARMLADIDLLVLPRLTLVNILRENDRIPNRVHDLDEAQVDALKDFIKSGRPVLFCLGPSNEPQEGLAEPKSDAIEKMLADFGVQLPAQTILYNVEGEAMADRSERVLMVGVAPEVPPVEFDWAMRAGEKADEGTPQPVRSSLKLTARSFGKSLPAELRLRHPRPVYYVRFRVPPEAAAAAVAALAFASPLAPYQAAALLESRAGEKEDRSAVILMTDAASWNEDQPFPTEKRTPQYERPKADDPSKGKIEEKRRGPFPIGVAFEAPVPLSWYGTSPPEKVPDVRIAVLGHGGVFLGKTLTPMREKLLLDVSNWLLGRDDLLAREHQTWQYPRVALSDTEFALWSLGAVLGLPLLLIFLGSVVLMVRQMR
jgi:hypothetical protein